MTAVNVACRRGFVYIQYIADFLPTLIEELISTF